MDTFSLRGPTLKTNLHTHTTFSDGKFSLPEVGAAYAELGFDVLAITDHNQWRRHDPATTPGLLVLSSNEPSLSNREHVLATGIHAPSPVDAGDVSCARTQEVIDFINDQGGFSTLNHPSWSGMTIARAIELQRYQSIEIANMGCSGHGSEFSLTHWDELLRRGRRVWGVATDDSHFDWDRGLGWIELFCQRDEIAILAALKAGRFYSSTGPVIEEITFDACRLYVRTEPVMGIAVLSGQGPIHVAHGGLGAVTELEWKLPQRLDNYVRVEAHRRDGRKAWTNPIFLQNETAVT